MPVLQLLGNGMSRTCYPVNINTHGGVVMEQAIVRQDGMNTSRLRVWVKLGRPCTLGCRVYGAGVENQGTTQRQTAPSSKGRFIPKTPLALPPSTSPTHLALFKRLESFDAGATGRQMDHPSWKKNTGSLCRRTCTP